MSLSRLRLLATLPSKARRCFSTSNKHLGGGVITYRQTLVTPPKFNQTAATVVGAFMWWWVFWHLWTDYGHITGEFTYPDPSQWTDEELGIPCDDDEDV